MNKKLVDAVRQHAIANYETGGWDILVECWEDEYLWERIQDLVPGCDSEKQAIKAVGEHLGVVNDAWEEQRAAARAEIF